MTPLFRRSVIMPTAISNTAQKDVKTVGIFTDIETCDTIEESLKSFDEIEALRIKSKREWR